DFDQSRVPAFRGSHKERRAPGLCGTVKFGSGPICVFLATISIFGRFPLMAMLSRKGLLAIAVVVDVALQTGTVGGLSRCGGSASGIEPGGGRSLRACARSLSSTNRNSFSPAS